MPPLEICCPSLELFCLAELASLPLVAVMLKRRRKGGKLKLLKSLPAPTLDFSQLGEDEDVPVLLWWTREQIEGWARGK